MQAMALSVAEQYVAAFGQLAKKGTHGTLTFVRSLFFFFYLLD